MADDNEYTLADYYDAYTDAMANPPKANDHSPLADAFYEGAAGVLPPKHGDYSPRSGYWHAGRDIAEPGMAIDAGGNADWLKAKKS